MNICIVCNKPISKYAQKYCSNKCQSEYNYLDYIDRWRNGIVSGSRGIDAKNLSQHVIRYINEKYNKKCARCGWNKINPSLGRSLLEIDHIDGRSDNNSESNLVLLCPNCHSLTPNYKNLNAGNGRSWRREKYVKMV